MPAVRDADGELVDAAATLVDFSKLCIVPGITLADLALFLISRHWCTHSHRTAAGRDDFHFAQVANEDMVGVLIKPIYDNLRLYKSCSIVRTVRSVTDQTHTFLDFRPPGNSGEWGTKESFEALERLWAVRTARGAARVAHRVAQRAQTEPVTCWLNTTLSRLDRRHWLKFAGGGSRTLSQGRSLEDGSLEAVAGGTHRHQRLAAACQAAPSRQQLAASAPGRAA